METNYFYLLVLVLVPFVSGVSFSLIEKELKRNELANKRHDLEGVLRDPKLQRRFEALVDDVAGINGSYSVAQEAKGCACVGYNCGCCLHVELKVIGLDSEVCVNVSYIPAPEYGVSVSLSIGGTTIINETISARNPPPICVDVPELKELASVCLRFSNLTVKDKSFSGCLSLEARLAKVFKADVPLGCFKIPPGGANKGIASVPPRGIMQGKQLTVLQDTIIKGRQFGSKQRLAVKSAETKTVKIQ